MEPSIITRKEAKLQSLKNYFTGKPCKNGHISTRLVSNGACNTCVRISAKQRYANDLEKSREYARNKQKLRRINNPDAVREYERSSYAKHRDRKLSSGRIRFSENRDRYNENRRKKYWENPENKRAAKRLDFIKHRDKRIASLNSLRAKRKNSEGNYTHKDIARIREAQGDKCGYCRIKLSGKGHIDHIIALSKGGSNWPRNLQLLCAPCNLKKRDHDPVDFARREGRLI